VRGVFAHTALSEQAITTLHDIATEPEPTPKTPVTPIAPDAGTQVGVSQRAAHVTMTVRHSM